MKFGVGIHGSQRMNPTEFGHPFFPVMPPADYFLFTYPVKHLNIYWMDWHKIWYRRLWF